MKRWFTLDRCTCCGSLEKSEVSYICPHCLDQMHIVNEEIYDKVQALDHLYTVGYHEGLMKTFIHRFKFEDHRYYARSFGELLLACGFHYNLFSKNTGILFVPMTKKEERRRGFHQCKGMVEEMRPYIPTIPVLDVVKKVKETKAQMTLSDMERGDNLIGAFHLI